MKLDFIVGKILGAVLQTVALIVLGRMTSTTEFGLFSTVFAIQATVFAVAQIGIPEYVFRETPRGNLGNVGTAFRVNTVAAILAFILSVSWTVAIMGGQNGFLIAILLGISFLFDKLFELRQVFALSTKKLRYSTLLQIVRPGLGIVFIFLLAPSIGVITAFVAGRLIGSLFAYLIIPKHVNFREMELTKLGIVLRNIWPLSIGTAVSALVSFDVAIVAVLAGPNQSAYYAVALKTVSPAAIISTAYAQSLMPKTAISSPTELRAHTVAVSKRALIVFFATFPFSLVISPMTVLLFGPKYQEAGLVATVMFFSIVPIAYESLLQAKMQVGNQETKNLIAVSINVILSIALVSLGASLNGALGAAVGFTMGNLVFSLLLWFLNRK